MIRIKAKNLVSLVTFRLPAWEAFQYSIAISLFSNKIIIWTLEYTWQNSSYHQKGTELSLLLEQNESALNELLLFVTIYPYNKYYNNKGRGIFGRPSWKKIDFARVLRTFESINPYFGCFRL